MGCGKQKTAESAGAGDADVAIVTTAASAVAPSPAATASAAPSATTAAEETLPTERRAERKAANEITHGNYKSELAKIEKELGAP